MKVEMDEEEDEMDVSISDDVDRRRRPRIDYQNYGHYQIAILNDGHFNTNW